MRLAATTAASGLTAAQTRLAVSAHNVANAATEPYTPQAVALSADAASGVQATVRAGTGTGVDLNREAVDQIVARNDFLANWAVFRRADEMTATLLKLKA